MYIYICIHIYIYDNLSLRMGLISVGSGFPLRMRCACDGTCWEPSIHSPGTTMAKHNR